jgi:hypothetical protein
MRGGHRVDDAESHAGANRRQGETKEHAMVGLRVVNSPGYSQDGTSSRHQLIANRPDGGPVMTRDAGAWREQSSHNMAFFEDAHFVRSSRAHSPRHLCCVEMGHPSRVEVDACWTSEAHEDRGLMSTLKGRSRNLRALLMLFSTFAISVLSFGRPGGVVSAPVRSLGLLASVVSSLPFSTATHGVLFRGPPPAQNFTMATFMPEEDFESCCNMTDSALLDVVLRIPLSMEMMMLLSEENVLGLLDTAAEQEPGSSFLVSVKSLGLASTDIRASVVVPLWEATYVAQHMEANFDYLQMWSGPALGIGQISVRSVEIEWPQYPEPKGVSGSDTRTSMVCSVAPSRNFWGCLSMELLQTSCGDLVDETWQNLGEEQRTPAGLREAFAGQALLDPIRQACCRPYPVVEQCVKARGDLLSFEAYENWVADVEGILGAFTEVTVVPPGLCSGARPHFQYCNDVRDSLGLCYVDGGEGLVIPQPIANKYDCEKDQVAFWRGVSCSSAARRLVGDDMESLVETLQDEGLLEEYTEQCCGETSAELACGKNVSCFCGPEQRFLDFEEVCP